MTMPDSGVVIVGTLAALGWGTLAYRYLAAANPKEEDSSAGPPARAGRKSTHGGKKFIIGGNWKCETNRAKVRGCHFFFT